MTELIYCILIYFGFMQSDGTISLQQYQQTIQENQALVQYVSSDAMMLESLRAQVDRRED
jgi:hypothetical protein